MPAAATAATVIDEPAPPPASKPLDVLPPPSVIPPNAIRIQSDGFCWAEFQVRLPSADMTPECLNDPGLWGAFQLVAQRSLKKFDRLSVIAHDESWLATCVVSDARKDRVALSGIKIVSLTPRSTALLESDEFRIRWGRVGYAIFRKSDNVQVTREDENLSIVERTLLDMSGPRRR